MTYTFQSTGYTDLVLRMPVTANMAPNAENFSFGNLQLQTHEGMTLKKKYSGMSLAQYIDYYQDVFSLQQAQTEIELSENKYYLEGYETSVATGELIKSADFLSVLLLKKLNEINSQESWVVLLSLEPHMGDYEEEVEDVVNFNPQDFDLNKWWFEASITFCQYRLEAQNTIKERCIPKPFAGKSTPTLTKLWSDVPVMPSLFTSL